MILIINLILIVGSLFVLSMIANSAATEKNKSFTNWLKSITGDLREQPLPVIIGMLVGKTKIAHSNRPYLAMTKNGKKLVKVSIVLVLLFIGVISWNFGWYHVAKENSDMLVNAIIIMAAVYVGIVLVIDLIFRVILISISGIYSGLNEDGFSIITTKFLALTLPIFIMLIIIAIPNIYFDVLTLGHDKQVVLWLYLGLSIFTWLFTFGLLFKTLLNPKEYFSDNLSLKNALKMSDHMIKGAFIMVIIIIVSIYTSVLILHHIDPNMYLFNEATARFEALQYVVGLMTTIGLGHSSPSQAIGMVITTTASITAIITFGLFIKAVFDRNFIVKEDGKNKGDTKFIYVDEMSISELRRFCADEGIKVPTTANRDDIIKILERLFT